MARAGHHAVRENRDRELFEIVGQAEIAAIEESAGLRGALEHQSATRADAERKLLGFSGAGDNFESVIVQAGIDFDLRDGVLHRQNIVDIRDGLERLHRVGAGAHAQDFALGFVRRVAHADAHQEPIELRFRQRVSAMMFDRILCGDYEKRIGERERFAVDSNLRFVHGFE